MISTYVASSRARTFVRGAKRESAVTVPSATVNRSSGFTIIELIIVIIIIGILTTIGVAGVQNTLPGARDNERA